MNEEDICGIAAFYLNIVLKVYAVFAYGKLIACVILVLSIRSTLPDNTCPWDNLLFLYL